MSTNGGTTRAVTYCRISSDPSGREAGVDRQQADCDRIAEAHGWAVAERIVDNDRSASRFAKREREGWVRIMHLIDKGAVDALVAYDLDRLLRQPDDLSRLIRAVEAGMQIVTATGKVDLTTAHGVLAARVTVDVAEHEAARVSERMKTKLRHDATNGRPHWSRRPYGYEVVGGEVQIVPAEAAVIIEMARRIMGGASATQVARWLNAQGHRTTGDRPWQAATVKMTLTNPRTAGLRHRVHRVTGADGIQRDEYEVVGPGQWKAILDGDTWEAVGARLAVLSRPRPVTGRRALLSGLVHCAVCNTPRAMHRTTSGGYTSFRCVQRPDGGCGASIAAESLEEVVERAVLDALRQRVEVRRRTATTPTGEDPVALELERDELARLFGEGRLPLRAFTIAVEGLERRIEAATALLADASGYDHLERIEAREGLESAWPEMDVDAQRALVALVVDDIRIGPRRARLGRTFDPSRIHISWKA